MKWIKQLLCRHSYAKDGGIEYRHVNPHYIVPVNRLKCVKCGKVVYR